MNKYGDYPFSVEQYAHLIAWLRPDFYASMDYPCEPEISRSLSLISNEDRIKKTLHNANELSKYEKHFSGKLVPVIQGYELKEYLNCIDLYKECGMIQEYMAVGSMCRRISSNELHELIQGIYQRAKYYGCNKLHFFGLKLSPDLSDLKDYIYSRDSAVALDAYDKGLRERMNGRRWPRGQEEKKESFFSFLGRIEKMGLNYIYTKEAT